ncbi:MAG: prefoldin subunit alpha [Candidatus Aenigmatarchaeota archaeon]|nr:prefoldin subunit alpha [Candidatus Aenigmarchaeota archaeon]
MTNEKELQEKLLIYRTLEARLEVLTRQRDLISSKIIELVSTMSSIDEIDKTPENILFKLGSEAFAQGNVTDKNKILVEIGAGIVLEKSLVDGKEILNKRKTEMENALKEIQNNISQISNAMNQLAPEINELIRQSEKQVVG